MPYQLNSASSRGQGSALIDLLNSGDTSLCARIAVPAKSRGRTSAWVPAWPRLGAKVSLSLTTSSNRSGLRPTAKQDPRSLGTSRNLVELLECAAIFLEGNTASATA